MHDLDPIRTPMWSFGDTNLGDRWILVALPPPVLSRPTFSASLRARMEAQYRKTSRYFQSRARSSPYPSSSARVVG
jgi:hypothetical protein